jgi:hypothetical protein
MTAHLLRRGDTRAPWRTALRAPQRHENSEKFRMGYPKGTYRFINIIYSRRVFMCAVPPDERRNVDSALTKWNGQLQNTTPSGNLALERQLTRSAWWRMAQGYPWCRPTCSNLVRRIGFESQAGSAQAALAHLTLAVASQAKPVHPDQSQNWMEDQGSQPRTNTYSQHDIMHNRRPKPWRNASATRALKGGLRAMLYLRADPPRP